MEVNIIAILGLVITTAVWLGYLMAIPQENVPERPYIHTALIVLGMGLSLWAMIRPFIQNESFPTLPIILGLMTLSLGGLFLYLLTIATLPDTQLAVKVGDRLPRFEVVDDKGGIVDTAVWHNQRLLLKFFRGHW